MVFSGLSNNICKLSLTVGCCENTIADKTIPANPETSMSWRSSHQKFNFFLRSHTVSSATMAAKARKVG